MTELKLPVECLHSRLVQIQGNLNEVKEIMTSWAQHPLFVRRDGKKDTTLCIEERTDRTAKRYQEIQDVAVRVHK